MIYISTVDLGEEKQIKDEDRGEFIALWRPLGREWQDSDIRSVTRPLLTVCEA
jgi:hypothetical protein